MKTTAIRLWTWTRWAALLALTATLAACGAAVTPEPAATSAPTQTPPAAEPFGSCDDSAIRLLDRGAGIHGAIVADTLHLGGATAPATCTDPTNESLAAGLPISDGGRTEQAQQSEYYLIVIRYTSGNRLYVISLRGDGTSCVVDTDDECVAEVTGLPDDFDLDDLPDDVARTIPAGRLAPPDVSPPGGDDTPPAPPEAPAASGPPGAASNPQPPDGATGVRVDAPILSWSAAPGARSYDVHWDTHQTDRASVYTTSTSVGMSARTSILATYGETGRLQPETTYYWRVDAKNVADPLHGCPSDGTCTLGQFWSFTTGPDEPEQDGPLSAPEWSDSARSAKLVGVTGASVRLTIPPPTGNPRPTISLLAGRSYGGGIGHWILPGDLRFDENTRTLTGSVQRSNSGTITLVATNSQGTSNLPVPYSFTCSYTQQELIRMWSGFHPITGPPPSPVLGRLFFTGVQFTASKMTVKTVDGDVDAEYLPRPSTNALCSEIEARSSDGTTWSVYSQRRLDRYLQEGESRPYCERKDSFWDKERISGSGVRAGFSHAACSTGGATPYVTLSFTKDHYSFAEEGENVTEEVLCRHPDSIAHHGPVCRFAYTSYDIPVEWSGPASHRPDVRAWDSNGTAHGRHTNDPHKEGDRGDYYEWGEDGWGHSPTGTYDIEIKIIQDDEKEEDETFYVYIYPLHLSPRGGSSSSRIDYSKIVTCERCRATVTIIDND